jgi:hypothetical protein
MAWKIKDEWIDLARSRHYVVFHNQDVLEAAYDGSGKLTPKEHHLVYEFGPWTDPATGEFKDPPMGPLLDMAKLKAETLAKLGAHHTLAMQVREKQPHVRLGSGPKK